MRKSRALSLKRWDAKRTTVKDVKSGTNLSAAKKSGRKESIFFF